MDRRVLAAIGDHPGLRAADLCRQVGQERLPFKINVRKLKALGLTESLEVGYRLSPRGRAVLERTPETRSGGDDERRRSPEHAWRRLVLPGHDAARLQALDTGWRLEGARYSRNHRPVPRDYAVACDASWRTTSARVTGWIGAAADGHRHPRRRRPALDPERPDVPAVTAATMST